MKARVFDKLRFDLRVPVTCVIVSDQMQFFILGRSGIDLPQEAQPFVMAMAPHTLADHVGIMRVDRHERRGNPIAFAVVGHALGQLRPWARSNPEALVDLILAMQAEVQALRLANQVLQRRVDALEARLAQNSDNSRQPPIRRLRQARPKEPAQKSGRRFGGQSGYPGNALKPVDKPTFTIVHPLILCTCGYGGTLRRQPVLRSRGFGRIYRRRQRSHAQDANIVECGGGFGLKYVNGWYDMK